MKRILLEKKIKEWGLDCFYSFGIERPECTILSFMDGKWRVYGYDERMKLSSSRWFETEDEACDYVYAEMLNLKKYGNVNI